MSRYVQDCTDGVWRPLHPVQKQIQLEDGRMRVVTYWACDSPSCDFRDVLHDRLEMPQVALEAISAERGFQVCDFANMPCVPFSW